MKKVPGLPGQAWPGCDAVTKARPGRRAMSRVRAAMALAASAAAFTAGVAALSAPAAAWAQQATATGEVRRVDAAAGTVTLKQGEIKELDLPAMTLVYHAAPDLLQKVKAGDKVRFTATRQDGRYVVIAIDKAVF